MDSGVVLDGGEDEDEGDIGGSGGGDLGDGVAEAPVAVSGGLGQDGGLVEGQVMSGECFFRCRALGDVQSGLYVFAAVSGSLRDLRGAESED